MLELLDGDGGWPGFLCPAPGLEQLKPGGERRRGVRDSELARQVERDVPGQFVRLGSQHGEPLRQGTERGPQQRGLAGPRFPADPHDPGPARSC